MRKQKVSIDKSLINYEKDKKKEEKLWMLQNSETSIYKHAYYERGVALRDVMYAHGNAGKNNMQKRHYGQL